MGDCSAMKKRSFLSISLSFLLILSSALANLYCLPGGGHDTHLPKDPKKSTCEPGLAHL
ncbi:MAG: hypothetical protein FD167_4370 [bacterium]|nr:MAG: hypothetical protein FD167_4370 [bacterium]